jgi:hypothetical protein
MLLLFMKQPSLSSTFDVKINFIWLMASHNIHESQAQILWVNTWDRVKRIKAGHQKNFVEL